MPVSEFYGTCACLASSIGWATSFNPNDSTGIDFFNFTQPIEKHLKHRIYKRTEIKTKRKPFKSESKAQELLRDIIGFEQWKAYRKTNRILISKNGMFWIIGNVFGKYNKFAPFYGKPDVVRIDNNKKLYATSFCVDQSSGESTPYTDKVITFTSHLMFDLKEFMKNANRINEHKLNKMKECAVWGEV